MFLESDESLSASATASATEVVVREREKEAKRNSLSNSMGLNERRMSSNLTKLQKEMASVKEM